MKNILITGTAGFIGFHLAERLKDRYMITGLDNINSYYDTGLKYRRLEVSGFQVDQLVEGGFLINNLIQSYRFIKGDLSDKQFLLNLFKETQFDLVIHLAAQAGVRYSLIDPDAYIQSNVVGFFNILEACRLFNIPKLIYASSSSVYGNNNKVPFDESHMVDNPESLYAATKKSNELMAFTYSSLYGIKTIGLRFFTVYGEWGRPDMAYFSFVEKILRGIPIEIFNNGDLQRDFTYIRDIIDGIELITQNDRVEPYKLYNIGNSNPIYLNEFIETIENALGRKAKKIFKPMQAGDVYCTYADINRMQTDFGYSPKVGIQEGLKRFVGWYKDYYGIE